MLFKLIHLLLSTFKNLFTESLKWTFVAHIMFLLDSGALNLQFFLLHQSPHTENLWNHFLPEVSLPSSASTLLYGGSPPATHSPQLVAGSSSPHTTRAPKSLPGLSFPWVSPSLLQCEPASLNDSPAYSFQAVQGPLLPAGISKWYFQTTSSSSTLEQFFAPNFLISAIHVPHLQVS